MAAQAVVDPFMVHLWSVHSFYYRTQILRHTRYARVRGIIDRAALGTLTWTSSAGRASLSVLVKSWIRDDIPYRLAKEKTLPLRSVETAHSNGQLRSRRKLPCPCTRCAQSRGAQEHQMYATFILTQHNNDDRYQRSGCRGRKYTLRRENPVVKNS